MKTWLIAVMALCLIGIGCLALVTLSWVMIGAMADPGPGWTLFLPPRD